MAVSDFWGDGMTEYEFTRTLSPAAVAALRLSLGIGDAPLLEALGSRFETTERTRGIPQGQRNRDDVLEPGG